MMYLEIIKEIILRMTRVFQTSNREGALEPAAPGPSCCTAPARFEAEFSSLEKIFRLIAVSVRLKSIHI